MSEGYIKFNCEWLEGPPFTFAGFQEMNNWRNKLYRLGLIGMNPDKIGYGNISIRKENTRLFYISGSATGGLERLSEAHFTQVTDYDFAANRLTCNGPIKASSESLSHAAVYLGDAGANAVIHVHHLQSWQKLKGHIPTTSCDAPYGTPEMSREILRLFQETDLKHNKVLVMGGHPEGIISFGRNMDEAGQVLLKQLEFTIDN